MFKKAQKYTQITHPCVNDYLEAYSQEKAVVLEKVHGVEYQVSYGPDGFTVGTGKKQLSAGNFIGDKEIREVIKDRVKLMYEIMKEQLIAQEEAATLCRDSYLLKNPEDPEGAEKAYQDMLPVLSSSFNHVTIRGTLYGGRYPWAAQLPNVTKPLKTHHHYAQNVSMAVHTIEVDGKPLGWDIAKILCFSTDLPTVPTVFIGSFAEAIAFSKDNLHERTLIPNGQPELDRHGNVIEPIGALKGVDSNERHGHVIRFVEPKFLPSGDEVVFKQVNHGKSDS